MNRNNRETSALRARDSLRRFGGKIAAGTALALTAGTALAQSAGSAAASAINAAKPDIELVQTAMLGCLILLVVFAIVRKSFGK